MSPLIQKSSDILVKMARNPNQPDNGDLPPRDNFIRAALETPFPELFNQLGYELTGVSINLKDQGTPKTPNINPNPSAHFHPSHHNPRLRKGDYRTKPVGPNPN